MSSEPAVSIHNVCKDFELGLSGRTDSLLKVFERRLRHPIKGNATREQFRALDDVSFDVAEGEAVGVIGKNGAGKSTLLKILSRITPPSAGYIELAGSVGSLLEVGTGFHPELTGLENVYLNGMILGMPRAVVDSKLDEIIAFAEVDRFLETPVKRYSSGMRVRLAFAVAAHLEPEILIIDEVLSVGDAGFQAKCLAKMKSVAADDGRTVLYVSHNLVTLEHLCPRTVLLADGRLVFDGPTSTTVDRYLRTFPRGEQGGTDGVFDLVAVDRSGTSYQKVFKRVEIRPHGGAPAQTVRMGESMQVVVDVEGLDEVPDALLNVTVGNSVSQRLFRMTSRMKPLLAAHARRPQEAIVITVPTVLLTPGEYHLDLHVKGRLTRDTLDFVSHAATFSVTSADVHGSGFQYTEHDGQFLVPWDWELRPAGLDA